MIGAAKDQGLEVRAVWVPLEDGYLLLPNALVAEVVLYNPPRPVPKTPDWLLGLASWRGQQVPLVSFERLIGRGRPRPGNKSRILVLYGLGSLAERLPYYGLLSVGMPRLYRASAQTLKPDAHQETFPAVAQGVLVGEGINQRPAWIPDVDYLAEVIGRVVGAASIAAQQTDL